MSEMTIYDNALIFSDETNHLYSLSLDGTLNWKLDLECPLENKLTVSDDFIIISTNAAYQTFYPDTVTNCRKPERIHIVDRKNGTLINIIEESTGVFSYINHGDTVIYSTGRKLFEISNKEHEAQPKLILDRITEDNRLRALGSDFHIKNQILYIKSHFQDVFAFNLDTREIKWRFTSDWNLEEKDSVEPTLNSRSLIYDEGVIYTVNKVQHSTAADVFAFDAESGVILGRYHIEAGASPGRYRLRGNIFIFHLSMLVSMHCENVISCLFGMCQQEEVSVVQWFPTMG